MSLERVIDRLEETARLLEEAGLVGLWVSSDDCSDSRHKRELLRDAGREAWTAQQALLALQPRLPHTVELVAALVAHIEPLANVVTDTMGIDRQLDVRISDACAEAEELANRLRRGTAPVLPES